MSATIFRFSRAIVTFAAALAVSVSISLPASANAEASVGTTQTAVLAGGCFWGMQDVFEKLRGVTSVEAGYSGGAAATAHYEMVSTGTTGHAESVRVTFDPRRISYAHLLDVYFTVAHDPTELNRQGPDAGTQYRSAIFYASPQQANVARAEIAALTARKTFSAPIVTQVVPLRTFYPAEGYHQHFADRHPDDPYIVTVDDPKVVALRAKFPQLLASQRKPTATVSSNRS